MKYLSGALLLCVCGGCGVLQIVFLIILFILLIMMVVANEYTKENHTKGGGMMVDKTGHQVGMASMEALQKHDGLLDMPQMKPAQLNAIKDVHMPVQWYHCLCTTAMVKEHAALMNNNEWIKFGFEKKCTLDKAKKREWIPCMPGKSHEAHFSSRVVGYLQTDMASIAVFLAAPARVRALGTVFLPLHASFLTARRPDSHTHMMVRSAN